MHMTLSAQDNPTRVKMTEEGPMCLCCEDDVFYQPVAAATVGDSEIAAIDLSGKPDVHPDLIGPDDAARTARVVLCGVCGAVHSMNGDALGRVADIDEVRSIENTYLRVLD